MDVIEGPPLGPGVKAASLEEVLGALSNLGDLDWSHASGLVIPVLPRLRPAPPDMPEPLQVLGQPGIVVGFGIDIGPAFMLVNEPLVVSWQVTPGDVHAQALANLHARAAQVEPSEILRDEIDGTPTAWLQTGRAIGSTLVLAPGELRRLFGPEPRRFITPMRDLIIALPADCDRDLAQWLYLEIASADPQCLGPIAYSFDGRRVAVEPFDARTSALEPVAPPMPHLPA